MTDLRKALEPHIGSGDVPGLVAALARRNDNGDDVDVVALGRKRLGDAEPIGRDAIFRISSMTKPITAALAMVLIEDGKLRLDEPVDRLLPELADRRVLVRHDGPLDDTVPARRAITVRDVLTFTFGIGMLFGPRETAIERAERALELRTFGPPVPATPHTPDEWLRRLGTLPLMFQPGERWLYNTSASVLGVLVARAAGQPFETVLVERLFAPLGMKDTAFSVPAAKRGRFVTCYRRDASAGKLVVVDEVDGQWSHPPVFPDGGAGLVSTIDDFLLFARMMVARGEHRGQRILSRESVEAMAADHLTASQRIGAEPFLDEGSWGFGMAVARGGVGRFGWTGGFGSSWLSDFRGGETGIILTQRLFDAPTSPPVIRDFWSAVGDSPS